MADSVNRAAKLNARRHRTTNPTRRGPLGMQSACASSSSNILAQYVAPEDYTGLTCREIGAEGERVVSGVAEISGVEYFSWPTPWLATSEDGTAELSKLKGEFEALQQASTMKRCSLSFKQQAGLP